MDKNSNAFTVVFATVICVVCAIALAATYNGLKERMDENALFDKHVNVLIAMGMHERSDTSKSRAELDRLYHDSVQGMVVEIRRDEVVQEVRRAGQTVQEKVRKVVDVVETDHKIEELDALLKAESHKPEAKRVEYAPVYRGVDDRGQTIAWCIPISGYGLWSTLYGYLALEPDLKTVRGITFYKHGETPGLGGEVENPNWQRQWHGKTILDDHGELTSVLVKKGKVDPKVPFEAQHMVDGLSGATITSGGVSRFVAEDLRTYLPFFERHRQS